jgi:hypothetical protein
MIGVTVFCLVVGAYVGWHRRIVFERERVREWIQNRGAVLSSNVTYPGKQSYRPSVPWIRRMLGDTGGAIIMVAKPLSKDDEEKLRTTFPETVEISVGTPIYPPSVPTQPATRP